MEPRRQASIRTIAALVLFTFSAVTLQGARRRAVAVPPRLSGPVLTFLQGPALDAGRIVWTRGATTVVEKDVKLRVLSDTHAEVTLRAFLEVPDSRARIRVNGVLLSAGPRIVQRHVPVRTDVVARIEIEVPVSAPEGPLAASIGWEITTE